MNSQNILGKRENSVPILKPVVDYHKLTEKEFNDYTNEIMQIFYLNDARNAPRPTMRQPNSPMRTPRVN